VNNFGNLSQQAYQSVRDAQEAAYKRGDYANMNAPTECKPAPVIEQQMQMLSDRLDILLAQISNTEARLAGVLRNSMNEKPMRDKLAGGTGVPLGDMLSGCVGRTQEAIDRLNSIQERIEL
jgi:hypothetical protein